VQPLPPRMPVRQIALSQSSPYSGNTKKAHSKQEHGHWFRYRGEENIVSTVLTEPDDITSIGIK